MNWRHVPLIWALGAGALSAQIAVQVREDKLSLSTWDEGPPDPDPQFASFYSDYFPNYPYPIGTPAGKTKHSAEWRVIILENEYLSCRILPDLGGHVHGCTDKITGREIFYANPTVRPYGANSRNNFIATGIESSFPVAHSRVASSPVDFAYSVRDGAGRVVLEDTDRVSGMQWRVEFILRPGTAVLEQHVTLHNGSSARRGYHWWSNAAIEIDDPHLRFVYPVKWMLFHGAGAAIPWPLDARGTDLSDLANHSKQIGLFGHGSREPWMAVYKPKFRAGVAHYANADEVPGKKIWLWGDDDKFVKENLTENFNSYVEMQAGLMETQPEFAFLMPGESKTFTHDWIPFHGLGGVSRVTPDAILNVARAGAAATIELQVTHPITNAKIRVSADSGARVVLETGADLDPRTVWSKSLDQAPPRLTVELLSASGAVLLRHVEGEYDALPFDPKIQIPEPAPPAETIQSESAILARGTFNEERDQLAFAWREYQAGLAKFPSSEALRKAAARLANTLNRFGDVVKILAPLVAAHPKDAEYQFYYGVAQARRGWGKAAKEALIAAAGDPAWAPAARLQLAMLAAREHDMDAAVITIQALAADSRASVRTGALEVAILRRAERPEVAKQRLRFWLDRDPANNMLRVERILLEGVDDPALWAHLAADPERVLDVVDAYLEIGGFEEALKLLDRTYPAVSATQTEAGAVLPQNDPLIAYYRAWCRSVLGQNYEPDFKTAASLSTRYVFPHRASSFVVLKAALALNNSDPSAHNLLGDLYFDSLDSDRAIEEWTRALSLKRDLPAIQRNLGRALLDVKKNNAAARPVLQEGARLNPGDTDITSALDRVGPISVAAKRRGTAGVVAAEPAPSVTSPPPAIPVAGDIASMALVRSASEPEKAWAMFTPANFPAEKQPEPVRRAYVEVKLQHIFALARAGRCGDAMTGLDEIGDEDKNLDFTLYGFGSFVKAPHFQYYEGVIESVCGNEKGARKTWAKLTKTSESILSAEDVFPYLALLNLGSSEAKPKIAAAIGTLTNRLAAGEKSDALIYAQGMLLVASGQREDGAAALGQAAQASDSVVQYLSLVALRELSRH